jgi:hypothetical protein
LGVVHLESDGTDGCHAITLDRARSRSFSDPARWSGPRLTRVCRI